MEFKPHSSGRDDDIFQQEKENSLCSTRRTSARLSHASPLDTTLARSHNRRMSGASASTNTTPRALGSRELEDRMDKLAKENFDLKMEVLHRREKEAKLDEKLHALVQLEGDYADLREASSEDKQINLDLIAVNEELVAELDLRDKAVEEAVHEICKLENRVYCLEQEMALALKSMPCQRIVDSSTIDASSIARRPMIRDASTHQLSRDNDNDNTVDNHHSSKRSNAQTRQDKQAKLALRPSFLDLHSHDTTALRALYAKGEIYASASASTSPDTRREPRRHFEEHSVDSPLLGPDDRPASPNIRNRARGAHKRSHTSSVPASSASYLSPASSSTSNARNARLNHWLEDRAVSPSDLRRSPNRLATRTDHSYSSLNDVLYAADTDNKCSGDYFVCAATDPATAAIAHRTKSRPRAGTDVPPMPRHTLSDALTQAHYPVTASSSPPQVAAAAIAVADIQLHRHRFHSPHTPICALTSVPSGSPSATLTVPGLVPRARPMLTFEPSFVTQTPSPSPSPRRAPPPLLSSSPLSTLSDYTTPRQTPGRAAQTSRAPVSSPGELERRIPTPPSCAAAESAVAVATAKAAAGTSSGGGSNRGSIDVQRNQMVRKVSLRQRVKGLMRRDSSSVRSGGEDGDGGGTRLGLNVSGKSSGGSSVQRSN